MMKHLRYMAVAALATVGTACSEAPTDVNEEFEGELVITEGVAAPEYVARVRPVFSDVENTSSNLGGSATTPLQLKPSSCEPGGQSVIITYRITGNQVGTSTFQVNSAWTFSGTNWLGSNPTTVTVPPRASSDAATIRAVTISVTNGSGSFSGTGSFTVIPFGLDHSNQTGAKLGIDTRGNVTIHVAFNACPVLNTPPTLVLPIEIVEEATTASGALVSYAGSVTATDTEDGDLTGSVICTPASGSQFPLGTTIVNCSVTDNGGLETTGSFTVRVRDTTPAYFTSFPTATVRLVAANINGAVLDIGALGITVADVGNVSEPSTFNCDYVAGTALEIGSTTTVYCTASDAIGNESDASSFDVFVGLNVNGDGFLPPLRMVAPFSAHKRGSTIPHKFLPPTYADGTPAIDLAAGLKLAIRHLDWQPEEEAIQVNDYSAGSTEWRYDAESGHYIFNLKTQTNWAVGSWNTTVSYADIPLATTQFELKK